MFHTHTLYLSTISCESNSPNQVLITYKLYIVKVEPRILFQQQLCEKTILVFLENNWNTHKSICCKCERWKSFKEGNTSTLGILRTCGQLLCQFSPLKWRHGATLFCPMNMDCHSELRATFYRHYYFKPTKVNHILRRVY
jgi:hypothetical protein